MFVFTCEHVRTIIEPNEMSVCLYLLVSMYLQSLNPMRCLCVLMIEDGIHLCNKLVVGGDT